MNLSKCKMLNIVFYFLFSLAYSIFLSLGLTCLLRLFGMALALSLDGGIFSSYPRFIPFCIVLAFLCIIAIIFIVIFNVKVSEKLNYTKFVWCVQFISSFIIAFFTMRAWEIFFDYLQKTF